MRYSILVPLLPACLLGAPPADRGFRSTYVLGPGDQIVIRAVHAEDVSDKPFRIEADGMVNIPLAGRLRAGGLTVEQFEGKLTERLKKYYIHPQIAVSITEFSSQPVSVLGAVANPGVHQLQGRKTIAEMLSLVGGLRPDAGPVIKIARLKRQWGPVPVAGAHDDPSGQYSVAELSVPDLLNARRPEDNILVRPNDVLTVPPSAVIYVVGEVKKAGGFVLGARKAVSVLEALSMAEGLEPRAAANHAKILRLDKAARTGRREIPVNLAKILAGRAADVPLEPDDILFIPNSAAKNAAVRGMETAVQIGTGLIIWRR